MVEETTYTGSSIWPSREDKLSQEKNVTTFRKGHAERDISDSTASVFVSDFKGRHWTRSMVWASRCGEMFSSSLAHWLIDTAHFTVHRLWFRWLLSVRWLWLQWRWKLGRFYQVVIFSCKARQEAISTVKPLSWTHIPLQNSLTWVLKRNSKQNGVPHLEPCAQATRAERTIRAGQENIKT